MTEDELIFAQRMLPHFIAGNSPTEAAQAVLADDARLFVAFVNRGHSYHIATADERSTSGHTGARIGDAIAAGLTATVYRRLRAEAVA